MVGSEGETGMGRDQSEVTALSLARALHADLKALALMHSVDGAMQAVHEVEDIMAEHGDELDAAVVSALGGAVAEVAAARARLQRIVIADADGTRLTWSWQAGAGAPGASYVAAVLHAIVRALDPEVDAASLVSAMMEAVKRQGWGLRDDPGGGETLS